MPPRRLPPRPTQNSQNEIFETNTESNLREVLVDDVEYVVSYGGTAQCQCNTDGSGAAACGLAALNFARVAFSVEQRGLQDAALLQAVLARECVEVRLF
jgi:hypothetical protein